MQSEPVIRAADLLHGALDLVDVGGGWVRPSRFSAPQLRALGSVRAWHPGLYRQMAACTAGVTVEFETDASIVTLELRSGEVPRGTAGALDDVARHTGVEPPRPDAIFADVDGRHLGPLFPDEKNLLTLDLVDPDALVVPLPGLGEPRRVRVWLPCLAPCSLRAVTHDGSRLDAVPARRCLLVLGDSVAQGFCADDPSRTWPGLLAEHLGLDLVNQGVGGQVFQPGTLAGTEALDVAAIVVELGENYRFEPCRADVVERDVRAYLGEVAAAWPDVPVWVLTTPPHLEVAYPTHPRSCYDEVDRIIAEAAARHAQMRLVDAGALLDRHLLPRLLSDGSDHPGPEGQLMIADRLSFVMDATWDEPAGRRSRALEVVRGLGDAALPLADALARGVGEVLLADERAVIVDVPYGARLLWSSDRKLVRRALSCLGAAAVTCVCGEGTVAREVARASRGKARPCELVVWRAAAPAVDPARDLRTLTPAYAGAIAEHYSHPEYLRPGELEELLAAGRVIGGFEDGRLVGFVGEHPHGAMGMLEVLPEARRRGWGSTLAAAKVRHLLDEGRLPWAEVWPDNDASLALELSMGFEFPETGRLWYVS